MATHYTPALGKSIIPQITSLGKDQSSKHELDVVFYLCNPRHQGLRHETLQFENILSESKFEASLVNILRPYFKRKRKEREDPPSVVSISPVTGGLSVRCLFLWRTLVNTGFLAILKYTFSDVCVFAVLCN